MEPLAFSQHKKQLFQAVLGGNSTNEFQELIDHLSSQGNSKKAIYDLFLIFFQEIQSDSKTKDNEAAYNTLADFMDGFTAWEKSFKILPDEPNL